MKSRLPSLRTLALIGLATAPALIAAPPVPMTEAEIATIQSDAASRASVSRELAATAETNLKADLADNTAASESVAAFLVKADLPAVKSDEDTPAEEAKPLEIPDDPKNTIITCDGGIYFDPEEGVLVYLKNVKIRDRRFDMTGANELKVFFEKKPPAPKKEKAAADGKNDKPATDPKPAKPAVDGKKEKKSDDDLGSDLGARVGDVERIIATGAIKIDHKPTDGEEPIQASGAIFTYNVKADVVTISGGFPWVIKGTQYIKSEKANNLLRIYPKTSSVDTPGGGWKMSILIPEKDEDR